LSPIRKWPFSFSSESFASSLGGSRDPSDRSGRFIVVDVGVDGIWPPWRVDVARTWMGMSLVLEGW
jgi:hypothetical protein